MKEYLSGGGFSVDCATEREEAQALIANVSYCAVIADLRLLGSDSGDGLDVVRAARGVPDPPPVIVVTGYPSDETRRAATAAGATAFFAKPFAAAGLLAAVQSSLAPNPLPREGERAG